jgi:alkanesulfonate monooxygenase SsuD/methylene tetrahydromethanopterin reductase-like flavin-dependent oxidoreductase (luciferase family)
MKSGVFFEQSVSAPYTRESEHRVFKQAADQAVLTDQLGFDSCWAMEHRFLPSYSHCSAPEIFLTHVAARTQNIRLGHGVRICRRQPGQVGKPISSMTASALTLFAKLPDTTSMMKGVRLRA